MQSNTNDGSPTIHKAISCLMLSHPAKTALENADIHTVSELCQTTVKDLQLRWNVGGTALAQIRSRLAEIGLALKGE
jgi:DNA-directed RNA polymerase alpha subunit